MGWSSGGDIFDTVAQALIDADAPYTMKREVCSKLIGMLSGEDWDTQDESLGMFDHDVAVVDAFREHGFVVHCFAGDEGGEFEPCERELGHDGDHEDYRGRTWSPGS